MKPFATCPFHSFFHSLKWYFVFATTLCAFWAPAQNLNFDESTTYALVVGISDYADPDIQDLRFAHLDAEVFTEYLQSPAGGSVPASNIRKFINEKAVLSQIDDAFNWLYTSAKDGDNVIIYFSGHGDVEKQTDWQLGYLLTYNTPFNNYRNQAVRMEDLNLLSLNLTSKKNVRVTIFLDACRAGKLAGREINGPSLTNEEALKREANDIRILSCKAGQESWESKDLGGGRGVFSYFLVNGLKGLADDSENADRNGVVTLEELSQFVKPKVRQEATRLGKGEKNQEPVFDRADDLAIAKVDQPTLAAVKQGEMMVAAAAPASDMLASRSGGSKGIGDADEPVEQGSIEAYFDLIEKVDLLETVDFTKIYNHKKEEITAYFLSQISMNAGGVELSELNSSDIKLLDFFENVGSQSPEWQNQFERRLAIALHNKGQKVLNAYLKTDTTEISRRYYFSDEKADYENYAAMFATAMNLLDADHPSYHKLEVKYHYFKGLATRIRVPVTKEPKELIRTAKAELLKALALDDKAAYIHNELGIIYRLENDLANAEKHYLIATDLSPTWACPHSNLCAIYLNKKDFKKAKSYGEKAKSLQPDFSGAYNNLGRVYEEEGDLLRAEELYLKSTKLNFSHFYPFERLANIYLQTTRYAQADTMFYEADIRKKGLFNNTEVDNPAIHLLDANADGVTDMLDAEFWVANNDTSALAEFYRGMLALGSGQLEEAELRFRKVIKIEKDHPLVYHYFGKMQLEQKRYEEAEVQLKYAQAYYLDAAGFAGYIDSLKIEFAKYPDRYSLPADLYKDYDYGSLEDYYLLAELYRSWQHYEEAEETYLDIIEMDSLQSVAYEQLWDLYEFLKRYKEAEDAIELYASIWEYKRYDTFHDFYGRMIGRFPEKEDWYYKQGILEYDNERNDEGMAEFKKVLELEPEHPARADLNIKIGIIYYYTLNQPDTAAIYYERAVAFEPDHANPRMYLVDLYHERERFTAGLAHLEYLYKKTQISYPHRLRLAEYLIHSSRFAEADTKLTEALNYDPQPKAEKFDLLGRSYLMSGRFAAAIEQYRKVLNLIGMRTWTREEINEETNHRLYSLKLKQNEMTSYSIQYSIARATAKLNNKKQALTNLEKALAYGFPFQWVLKYDATWNDFRNDNQWQTLMKKYFKAE